MEVNFKTVSEAIQGHKKIEGYWKRYLKNLKEHLSRDYYAVVDSYKEDSVKDGRAKIASSFSTLEDAVLEWMNYANPYRYSNDPAINPHYAGIPKDVESRMDYYVNNQFKYDYHIKKSSMTSEKLWSSMRYYIKLLSGAKEVDYPLEAPETADFMGLTFVNDLYNTKDDLQKKFTESAPWLRLQKSLMPEVFYGKVFLKKKPWEAKKTVKLGDKFLDAEGFYHSNSDTIDIHADELKQDIKNFSVILIHELAHRYYYKFMDASGRKRWEHFFNDLKSSTVTDYAGTNPAEDFAESVLHYVYSKGYMKNKDVRDRLEAILKGRIKASIEQNKDFLTKVKDSHEMRPLMHFDGEWSIATSISHKDKSLAIVFPSKIRSDFITMGGDDMFRGSTDAVMGYIKTRYPSVVRVMSPEESIRSAAEKAGYSAQKPDTKLIKFINTHR
jgi:hypothetical protein